MIDYINPTTERNLMLKAIRSPHFLEGGTGITNISAAGRQSLDDRAAMYFEAIKRHGDSNYVVSKHPMEGSKTNLSPMYSLHYIGATFPRNCSAFWSVYNAVQDERDAEQKRKQEEEERLKREAALKPFIAEFNALGVVSYHIGGLSPAHCRALVEVFARVGGSPEGMRGKIDDLKNTLVAAGFINDFANRESIAKGSVYFQ